MPQPTANILFRAKKNMSNLSGNSHLVTNLMDKMQSMDKDFRFMAINDLIAELQKSTFKIESNLETGVVQLVLKLLEDKNGEVQNLAVKCLGLLITRVSEPNSEVIWLSLCTSINHESDHLRDISCMGLKNIISAPNMDNAIALNIFVQVKEIFILVLESGYENEALMESLEVLIEILSRFGKVVANYVTDLIDPIVTLIQSKRQVIRKKTSIVLSSLAMICSQENFDLILDKLYSHLIEKNKFALNYIQATTHLSREAGLKFNNDTINKLMTQVERYLDMTHENCSDETRDYCFKIFESLVVRCGIENRQLIEKMIDYCIRFVSYDPNYNYSDFINDDFDSDRMDADDEYFNDEDLDDDLSDDDDISWKVRISALKCIEATILKYPQLLHYFHEKLIPVFVLRFKERKENVKSAVIHLFITLLEQTNQVNNKHKLSDDRQLDVPLNTLLFYMPEVYKNMLAMLCDRSMKIRQDCSMLLQEIVVVLPNIFKDNITDILNALVLSLKPESHENSLVKKDALVVYNSLIKSHDRQCFFGHIEFITPLAIHYVSDSFNKVAFEALSLLENIVLIIKDVLMGRDMSANDAQINLEMFKQFIPQIYKCAMDRSLVHDIDQDVKEKSMLCLSHIISSFYNMFPEINFSVEMFLTRLKSESIRLTAVKCLINIAKSEYNVVAIKCHMKEIVALLCSFLCQKNRALKMTTLLLLQVIVEEGLDSELSEVLQELPNLTNESDLQLTQMVVNLFDMIITKVPFATRNHFELYMLPTILKLLKSSLLQGNVLKSILNFISHLSTINHAEYPFLPNLDELSSQIMLNIVLDKNDKLPKQALISSAEAIATVLHTKSLHDIQSTQITIKNIFDQIGTSSNQNDVFYLITIGEIGKKINLAFMPNLTTVLINEYFSHPCENAKLAASYAYGILIVGNLDYFLPPILDEISQNFRKQYLLLNSLRETISYLTQSEDGSQQLALYVEKIYQALIPNCDCSEEGSRNAIAECIAKITLIAPEEYLNRLKEMLDTNVANVRATIITSFKYINSNQNQEINRYLEPFIQPFMALIYDKDLTVRRYTLITFNSIVHNKPKLIYKHLQWILPTLYEETKVKPELIHEVEMGPFRHTVDDGLDNRKVAFECMCTLLSTCAEYLDIELFIIHLENGLNDHYDVKMIVYLMMCKLVKLRPKDTLKRLDSLIDILMKTCMTKVKSNSVKQEYEKMDELKKAALRTASCLLKIPDARQSDVAVRFHKFLRADAEMNTLYTTGCQDDQGYIHTNSAHLEMEM